MENETVSPIQFPETPRKENSFLIPGAIIIAGLLIGGAILYSNRSNDAVPKDSVKKDAVSKNLVITPAGKDDRVLGDRNADAVFIEYSDMECPFCKTFHQTMNKIVSEYGKSGKVAWVYRHYPIDAIHSKARKEAEAVECAGELGGDQKFWQYLDKIFSITPSNNGLDPAKLYTSATDIGLNTAAFTTCLQGGKYAEKVQNDMELALKAGGAGTPHTTILLKKKIDAASKKILEANFSGIRDQNGELLITISPDNLSIVMRGAMPYEIIKPTLEEIFK